MNRVIESLMQHVRSEGAPAWSRHGSSARLRRFDVDGLTFFFRDIDGEPFLCDIHRLHRLYREGRMTEAQCRVVERALAANRQTCSAWDAQTEAFREEIVTSLERKRPGAVRRLVEPGSDLGGG